MKCVKCGAEIPKNCMYCKMCGKEVQLVPDYNFLEDDILSYIVEEGAKKTISPNQQSKAVSQKKECKAPKQKKKMYLWGGICIIIVCAVITFFIVQAEIKKQNASSYDYQLQKAEEYEQEDDYLTALTYYYNAWELNKTDSNIPYRIVLIYMEINEEDKAVDLLKKRIKEKPTEKAAYELLISIYDEEEDYESIRNLCVGVADSDILDLFEDYLVEQPKFEDISGSYTVPFSVKIFSKYSYSIYYTVDGSDPVKHGMPYHQEIELAEGTTTVKAVTENEAGIFSEVVSNTYQVTPAPPAAPKITPESGTYDQPVNISIQIPKDSRVYYTWDQSTPTEESQAYMGEFQMPQGENILTVIAYNSYGLKSNVSTAHYIYMQQ